MNFNFFLLRLILGSIIIAFACNAQNSPAGEIKGIVLLRDDDQMLNFEQSLNIEGLDASRVVIPGCVQTLREELKRVYLNQPWCEKTIQAVKQQIYRYYQEQEYPFILILTPPQDKKSKVLQLIIIESRMGALNVIGKTKIRPSRHLRSYFKTLPGNSLNQRRINKDLHFINRNPFRGVNAVFSPGTVDYTTDVTLYTDSKFPIRVYSGADNSGVSATGRQRIFAGLGLNLEYGFDQCFFYQYTTNGDNRRFHSSSFQYIAYLPCELVIDCFGGFSVVRANLPYPNRANKGTSTQGSARLRIPFFPVHSFDHEATVGFDLKHTNNTVEYVDATPRIRSPVNLFQLMAGYKWKWEKKDSITEIRTELFCSPGRWLPKQTRDDFASLRPKADNTWIRLAGFVNCKWFLPRRFIYTFSINGQWSEQALIPSEQIGLGGYNSIRGYEERQYNADSGFMASGELHLPSFSIFRSKSSVADSMSFLLFLDGGFGINAKPILEIENSSTTTANTNIPNIPEIKRQNFLLSVGPGVRYSFGPYLTARCDWGIKLHHQSDFAGGSGMVHFSVEGSY